jgi:iron-sulfur cluster insertion protein
MDVTNEAVKKIIDILQSDPELEGMGLRVGIVGGGCSGFQYNFTFDKPNEDDWTIPLGDYTFMIDPMSYMYLNEATLDFKEDPLQGASFVVNNPNAQTTCGCGSSFSA